MTGGTLSDADRWRRGFRSIAVNEDCSEAVLVFNDDSRLHFCHRVGERFVQATGAATTAGAATLAAELLASVATFRLNARHLDLQFADGSRWETLFAAATG